MDPSLHPSVSISTIRAIHRYLESNQIDPQAMWNGTPLSSSCMVDRDYRIRLNLYHQIWNNAIQASRDPALGLHVGEQNYASEMGLVANVLIHEETLGDSLRQYVRLYSLVNDGITLHFDEGATSSRLFFKHIDSGFYNISDVERTLVVSITRSRLFVHRDIKLKRVGFAHSAPDYLAEYQRIFDCPIEFNQTHSFIELENEYLMYSPVRKNPYTRSALLSYANNILNKINRKRFSNQVRKHIVDLLQYRKADVDEVAKRLHMSRHTLYRKLKVEDIAFQDLVDEVRREQAIEMVESSEQSLSEVAFLLGFSELSSFSRAFKRWTGKSPRQYRNPGL